MTGSDYIFSGNPRQLSDLSNFATYFLLKKLSPSDLLCENVSIRSKVWPKNCPKLLQIIYYTNQHCDSLYENVWKLFLKYTFVKCFYARWQPEVCTLIHSFPISLAFFLRTKVTSRSRFRFASRPNSEDNSPQNVEWIRSNFVPWT